MNKSRLQLLGFLFVVGLAVWGPVVSAVSDVLAPDADTLQTYLMNKGLLVAVLLPVMARAAGLRYFGVERGSSWWFLVPALPILLLTGLVLIDPNAAFGLSMSAAAGWILVSLFVGISEECIFRGILWRAFEDRGIFVTAVATSALFGTAHLLGLFAGLPWEIILSQAFFAFGVGMMFAAVRFVSGSVLAPIVLHTVFDASAVIAAGGVTELLSEGLTAPRLLIPGALFAVWGLVSLVVVNRRRTRTAPITLQPAPAG